jgi:hypothetical protein
VDKLNKVLEGYKPIPMKRLFYPRGMRLSEEFVNAFHKEYDRLVNEGINPKTLVERFGKAMKFHVNDTRRYQQLDEESKAKRLAATRKKAEDARRKRERKKGKQEAEQEHDLTSTGDDPHGNGDSGITQS